MSSEQELTEKQKAFLEALADPETGGHIRSAMRKAGYSENTKVSEVLSGSIGDIIRDNAKKFLAQNSFRAAHALLRSMDSPDEAGTANRLKAAESILNRVGVKESENAVKIPESGLVILPAKLVSTEDKNTNDDSEE